MTNVADSVSVMKYSVFNYLSTNEDYRKDLLYMRVVKFQYSSVRKG